MAEGVRRLSQARWASRKAVWLAQERWLWSPLGTVWAAVVTPERELQRELHLPGNRVEVMEGIVERVLEMLEEALTPSQSA